MSKQVIVISHERSGTHFLIDTLVQNFGYPEKHISMDATGSNYADPEFIKEYFETMISMKGSRIIKSHHPFCFLDPVWPLVRKNFKVFYVSRDGRDVMVSFWNHLAKRRGELGPTAFDVASFMPLTPDGMLRRYYGPGEPDNMVERWTRHVVSWMKEKKAGVCYVSYERLSRDFEGAVAAIAKYLGVETPGEIVRPPVGGVDPGKGIVGGWKRHFPPEACKYFEEWGKAGMELL